jgi:hypothetical protein
MTNFILGFLAGGFMGTLTMCLCAAAGNADRNEEDK